MTLGRRATGSVSEETWDIRSLHRRRETNWVKSMLMASSANGGDTTLRHEWMSVLSNFLSSFFNMSPLEKSFNFLFRIKRRVR